MKNTISKQCAQYKFESQAGAYFKHSRMFSSINQLQQVSSGIPNGTFCLVTGPTPHALQVKDFFLCEALSFPSERMYSLTAIKRQSCKLELTFPQLPKHVKPTALSISFICTEDKLYVDFLRKAITHYNKMLTGLFEFEIHVAFFGKPENLPPCKLTVFPAELFHMAFARNQSLKGCEHNLILMLDLDCYLSREQIQKLINNFVTLPHHEVFNLKQNYRSGNGLYLGTKNVLLGNEYNEDFKDFWFEDTEYLMNFSRKGIVPCVEIMNFVQVNHDRTKTIKSRRYQKHNKDLFERILKYGR